MNIDLSTFYYWIQEQISLLILYGVRPAVQRQIGAIAAILLITWLAPRLLDMIFAYAQRKVRERADRSAGQPSGAGSDPAHEDAAKASAGEEKTPGATHLPDTQQITWQERVIEFVRAVNFVLFPILAIFSFHLTINYFANQGWPYGLIDSVLPILWLVLAYRLIFSTLLTFLPRREATRWHARYLRPLVTLLVLLVLNNILFSTLGLGDFVIISIQEFAIRLGGIFTALEILLIAYIASWLVFDAIYRVLQRNKAEPGLRETVSKVARYSVFALGGIFALGALGVDLGTLGWITTGLSVGIGFGLQELFANFASGIVLTFERSVRPGDVIESGGQRGTVSEVGMRATIVRTADRAEVFIPNKELMTKPLIALTYSDRMARVALNIGVAYGSDIDKTNEILLSTITRHPLILADPAPGVMLTELGAYSINFAIFGFVSEFSDSFRVRAELFQMTRDALVQHGIEIPFPRTDTYIVRETHGASDQRS